jgi:glycosyltransferase involved in cell wall biosynthesis
LNEAAEVIRDGQDGLLVHPGDVNKFAEATLKLINDPEERSRLGRNARAQAVNQYSWENYTKKLEEIYFKIVGNAPSGSPLVDISGNH